MRISSLVALLKKRLKENKLIYRIVLKRRGASFFPRKISVPGLSILNTTLKSKEEWEDSLRIIQAAGLIPHPDPPKNWDALASLDFILKNTNRSARILDAGGERYSPLVEWLVLHGYKNLDVINLVFDADFKLGPIRYIKGDCTDTPYPEAHFDVVSCLSVIEHGVDVDNFLRECCRILRRGGFLIVSTDFWKDPIDTHGKRAYGTEVKVLTPNDILKFIDRAKSLGLVPTGTVDLSTEQRVVRWVLEDEYTFIAFALRKV